VIGFLAALPAVAVIALVLRSATRPPRGRHTRTRATRSLPHEMRSHRTPAGTWRNTLGARAARLAMDDTVVTGQPAPHALDRSDPASMQHRAANRYEDTGEITQAGLAALFGPRSDSTGERPALVGAS
jgi:hypothetical protein